MGNFRCASFALLIATAVAPAAVYAQQSAPQPQTPKQAADSTKAAPGTTVEQPEPNGPPPKPNRPTIGLVFEGGGALGFAHIGVLEYLEAHHIPVDYVAGTSMGGLVGGLYAAGNSPADITKFVGKIDWALVLSGQIPFPSLSYRRKEDRLAYPNRLEFGLKHGLSLPNGLNSGSAVSLLFDRTLLPYYDLKSFNDLPIPFRCVATNLTTGQQQVFDDGSLPEARRATMSIPAVFAPVVQGKNVYSDGGAVNNLPVDVARKMGADIIIAVYLNTGPVNPKTLTSPLSIAGRNISIMVAANELNSMKSANILLQADVSKFGSADFGKSEEIIPQGLKAAQQQAAALDKYALSPAAWNAYVAERNSRRRTKVPIPQFVDVMGLKGTDKQQVQETFQGVVGKKLDTTTLDNDIADLEGTGTYSSISYRLQDRNGKPGLVIAPQPKSYGPPFLDFGLTLSSNDSNDIELGFGARATCVNIAGPGSELRTEVLAGQVAGGSAELYKSLKEGSRWFIAPHVYLHHSISSFYSGSTELAQYKDIRNGVGADLAYQFNSKTEARIGEDYQWFHENRTVGEPVSQEFDINPAVTNARIQYLGQNDVMVPTSGWIGLASYSFYNQRPAGTGGFSQLSVYGSRFYTPGLASTASEKKVEAGKTRTMRTFDSLLGRGTFFAHGEGGTSFKSDNLGLAGFNLGGPLRMSAYQRYELLGNQYFFAQTGYLYRLARLNPVIGDAIYADGFYEISKVANSPNAPKLPQDISGAVIVKTLIGPIYGGGSIGDSGHRKWFFGLGRVF
jgi:NTE family protein